MSTKNKETPVCVNITTSIKTRLAAISISCRDEATAVLEISLSFVVVVVGRLVTEPVTRITSRESCDRFVTITEFRVLLPVNVNLSLRFTFIKLYAKMFFFVGYMTKHLTNGPSRNQLI